MAPRETSHIPRPTRGSFAYSHISHTFLLRIKREDIMLTIPLSATQEKYVIEWGKLANRAITFASFLYVAMGNL